MAGTIRFTNSATVINGDYESSFGIKSLSVVQTTQGESSGVQFIGNSAHEELATTDVANKGYAYFRNLDSTNFVEIGVEVASAFHPLVRLKSGEFAQFRLNPTVTIFAKADTATVNLQKLILSD